MGAVDWAKAVRRSAAEAVIPQRFVFHHIPKCGGTSVGRALRRRCLLSQATISPEASYRALELFSGQNDREQMLIDVLDFREQMLLYFMFDDVRGISAHVRFSGHAYDRFSDRYKFITVLRHPVERFISNFFWSAGKPEAHGRIEENLATFLDTDRARRLGATLVEYLCGLPKEVAPYSDEAVAAAVENLAKFDVVGDIRNIADLEHKLRVALGFRVSIGHENKGRARLNGARRVFDDATLRSRIEALCAPDIAVYSRFVASKADNAPGPVSPSSLGVSGGERSREDVPRLTTSTLG
jgi:hypothetical protein